MSAKWRVYLERVRALYMHTTPIDSIRAMTPSINATTKPKSTRTLQQTQVPRRAHANEKKSKAKASTHMARKVCTPAVSSMPGSERVRVTEQLRGDLTESEEV